MNENITIIGSGYVGLVTSICFASLGHYVRCMDIDEYKIEQLRNNISTIYEPGLEEHLHKLYCTGRLEFSTDFFESVDHAEIIMIALGTPSLEDGGADLSAIYNIISEIAIYLRGYKIIIIKSTVPVGTCDELKKRIIALRPDLEFDLLFVPEFMREGSAISDSFHPEQIIIGTDNVNGAAEIVQQVYRPLSNHIFLTSMRNAEMIKYATNSILATKISFINEISNICEKVGADILQVAKGIGLDSRVGSSYLNAGVGYGGSCFPKDVKALIHLASQSGYDAKMLKSVDDINSNQFMKIIDILEGQFCDLTNKTIGIWGLAFKPQTDDIRNSPSIGVVRELLKRDCVLKLFDPRAMDNFKLLIKEEGASVIWCEDMYEAVTESDVLCILTEWEMFLHADLRKLETIMKNPFIVDGRNVYNDEKLESSNIQYFSIGREPKLLLSHKNVN
ncbi:UDP-glucose dehydrogenase family protein [Paenibacillus xylanexedens]|uniref:UDP-glucose dehydrogenase family protein n=1 Tax=Paenibacillus xylanexedens TaxID=528191 RepID=UPI003CFBC529